MMPLAGLRVVVTRAVHQAEELATPLRDLGAEVILLPVIGIGPPLDPEPLRRVIEHADEYDWIIFTSANAVAAFAGANPRRARIAAIGPATQQAVEAHGWPAPLLMPDRYVAESLIDQFVSQKLENCRILIPSAAKTRDIIPNELRKLGALVDVVEAYRNILPPEAREQARRIFCEPFPDWITFASSSAVKNLVEVAGRDWVRFAKIASIGPVTSATAREYGIAVAAEAESSTVQGLVDAIVRFVKSASFA